MAGIPEVTKRIDAWTASGPIESLIYGNTFKAFPVAAIRLEVGDHKETVTADPKQAAVVFRAVLPAGDTGLKATMLDTTGREIGSAYHVYVRPLLGE